MENIISMSKKKAEMNGEVSPDVLVDNLRKAIVEESIESVVYITKDKDGTFSVGHSTLLGTEVLGHMEIGKQIVLTSMCD